MRASQWTSSSIAIRPSFSPAFVGDLLPKGLAGELALVEGVAIGPVEGVKTRRRQARDAHHRRVRRGVWRTGQYHSVVENHRAQSQIEPSRRARVLLERALISLCTIGPHGAVASGAWLQHTMAIVDGSQCAFRRRTDWNTEESELARAHRARLEAGLPDRRPHRLESHALRIHLSRRPARRAHRSPRRSITIRSRTACSTAREAVCDYYADHGVALDPSQLFSPPAPARPTAFSSACSAIPEARFVILAARLSALRFPGRHSTMCSSSPRRWSTTTAGRSIPEGFAVRSRRTDARHRPRAPQQSHRPLHQAVGSRRAGEPLPRVQSLAHRRRGLSRLWDRRAKVRALPRASTAFRSSWSAG